MSPLRRQGVRGVDEARRRRVLCGAPLPVARRRLNIHRKVRRARRRQCRLASLRVLRQESTPCTPSAPQKEKSWTVPSRRPSQNASSKWGVSWAIRPCAWRRNCRETARWRASRGTRNSRGRPRASWRAPAIGPRALFRGTGVGRDFKRRQNYRTGGPRLPRPLQGVLRADLERMEAAGLVAKGTVVVADNVVFPGAPGYLDKVAAPAYATVLRPAPYGPSAGRRGGRRSNAMAHALTCAAERPGVGASESIWLSAL